MPTLVPRAEDNGLNPAWSEEAMKFDVSCPELAFLRFEVLSEVNDSKTTIAQGTFPVTGLRQGRYFVLFCLWLCHWPQAW